MYTRASQLPKSVRDPLPTHAQHIYMSAHNSAMKQGHDETGAAAIAWGAVKNSYVKDEETGKWKQLHKVQHEFYSEFEDKLELEGKEYWKEVIKAGLYKHPQDETKEIKVTDNLISEWVSNFKAKAIKDVPIPITHAEVKDPSKNTGFITDLQQRGSSLWAKMNIAREEIAQAVGNTIKGVSLSSIPNYINEKGEWFGNVIDHICLTNSPHIQDVEGFMQAESDNGYNILHFERKEERKNMPETKENKKEGIEKKEEATKMEFEKEYTELKVEFEKLQAEKEKIAKTALAFEKSEDERIVDDMLKEGKLTPAMKPFAFEIIRAGRNQAIEFENNGKKENKSIRDLALEMFKNMPKIVNFETISKLPDEQLTKLQLEKKQVEDKVKTVLEAGKKRKK